MELYKQIKYEGGTLRLFGKYMVAKPSFEGSLPEPSSFDIYNVEVPLGKGDYQDVSEHYEDLFDELEKIAIEELDKDTPREYKEVIRQEGFNPEIE